MTMYLDVLLRTYHLTIIQEVKSSNLDMTIVMSMTPIGKRSTSPSTEKF